MSAATGANANSSDERKANEREPIYALPFLGAAAVKEGASLPLPIGHSILGQYQREQIRAHGLQVGLGGGPLINADFVGFNGLTTRVRNLLFRGDFWVLPFLNVYGIAGSSWASTTTSLNRPITLITSTDSQGTTLGFGGTLAYGVEPYGFITLDANLTWSDQVILSVPARTVAVTPRVGIAGSRRRSATAHFRSGPGQRWRSSRTRAKARSPSETRCRLARAASPRSCLRTSGPGTRP